MDKAEELMQWVTDMALAYGIKLIGALVVLIIGLWIIKAIMGVVRKSYGRCFYRNRGSGRGCPHMR